VQVDQVEGFLPYSQLAATTLRKDRSDDMSYLVGVKLKACVLQVSALRNDGARWWLCRWWWRCAMIVVGVVVALQRSC
jgi:hypothetical protein